MCDEHRRWTLQLLLTALVYVCVCACERERERQERRGAGGIRKGECEEAARKEEERKGTLPIMLCCMRRTKQVEKNDEVDQKIEQDGTNKPEDKAHKAATKIQASFRGHIIRKKLKGDKKENGPEANGEVVEKKNEIRAEVENHKSETPVSEVSQSDGPQSIEGKKTNSSPTEERKLEKDGVLDAATKPAEPSQTTPVEEKQAATETENTTQVTSETLHPSDADGTQAKKEESKQANVPATSPTTDAAKAKEQSQTETADASQVEEKTDAVVEETKPTQSAQREEVKDGESKEDQENA